MTSPFEHAAALKAALAVSAPLAPLLPALNKLSVSDTSEVLSALDAAELIRLAHGEASSSWLASTANAAAFRARLRAAALPAEDAARAALCSSQSSSTEADRLLFDAFSGDQPQATRLIFGTTPSKPAELQLVFQTPPWQASTDGLVVQGKEAIAQTGGRVLVAVPRFCGAELVHSQVYTMGQLDGLDWTNVIAAGGSVLACATTPRNAQLNTAAAKAATKTTAQLLCRAGKVDPALSSDPAFLALHGRGAAGGLSCADIDLWLHGLSPAQAVAKVEHIGDVLRAAAAARGSQLYAAKTKNTVTFFFSYPFRMVQVITSVFTSPAQVLLDFDLDCCALAWDGSTLLALPRAAAAVSTRCNVMRSDLATHAMKRTLKYALRGFSYCLPTSVWVPSPTPSEAAPSPSPSSAAAASLDAARLEDVLAMAKLGLLMRAGAPLWDADILSWRTSDVHALFPRLRLAPPAEAWVAGYSMVFGGGRGASAAGDGFGGAAAAYGRPGGAAAAYGRPGGARGPTYAAGPPTKKSGGGGGGAGGRCDDDGDDFEDCYDDYYARPAPGEQLGPTEALCEMMSRLYTSSPRAPRVSGRSFADKPPGFPEQLARPGDYGDGAPDMPYGPPLPGDARTKPLRPLDLEPYSCFGPGRGDNFDDPPHHPPVSADETASMMRARAEGTAVVATTAAALRPLLKFSRAAFADALALRSALPDSAGEYIPIFVDEGASPPLPLGALKKASARSTAPLSGGAPPPPSSSAASAPATAVAQFTAPAGCVWRATLSMKPPPGGGGGGATSYGLALRGGVCGMLTVSLELLAAPMGELLCLPTPTQPDAPGGATASAAAADAAPPAPGNTNTTNNDGDDDVIIVEPHPPPEPSFVEPFNIVVDLGRGGMLDVHAALCAGSTRATWSHFVYGDHASEAQSVVIRVQAARRRSPPHGGAVHPQRGGGGAAGGAGSR